MIDNQKTLLDLLDHLDDAIRELINQGEYGKAAKMAVTAQQVVDLLDE